MPTCLNCTSTFSIPEEDLTFYQKVSPVFNGKKHLIPPPTHCPDCRQQRRVAFRNERNLYRRKSDMSGEEIITMFHPDAPYTIYTQSEWWSDAWDACEYAKEYDERQSFFDQYRALQLQVPRQSLYSKNNSNSDYTNHSSDTHNCYLSFDTANIQDCMYVNTTLTSKNCMDAFQLRDCELCYDVQYGYHCYHCVSGFWIHNCSDSAFLYACRSCKNCFCCANLRNREYCIMNKQYSKEEYDKELLKIELSNYAVYQSWKKKFEEFIAPLPKPHAFNVNTENCSCNYIYNSQNVCESYDIDNSQDCKYCYVAVNIKDCYDTTESDTGELEYECHASNNLKYSAFCKISHDNYNLFYCDMCHNSHDLFGCIGLKNKQYCILNKQYSKEEYEKLVAEIIEHMREKKEWGEFFPIELSFFPYNDTVAQEYYPQEKSEVLKKGLQWKEKEDSIPQITKTIPAHKLPDETKNIPNEVLDWAITCEISKRPYKLQKAELDFYRTMKLPVPHTHPDIRHALRLKKRNPRKLWKRECSKCSKEIQTSYAPERPEKVYCEECYLKEVY